MQRAAAGARAQHGVRKGMQYWDKAQRKRCTQCLGEAVARCACCHPHCIHDAVAVACSGWQHGPPGAWYPCHAQRPARGPRSAAEHTPRGQVLQQPHHQSSILHNQIYSTRREYINAPLTSPLPRTPASGPSTTQHVRLAEVCCCQQPKPFQSTQHTVHCCLPRGQPLYSAARHTAAHAYTQPLLSTCSCALCADGTL
jgi:hypothetical protein